MCMSSYLLTQIQTNKKNPFAYNTVFRLKTLKPLWGDIYFRMIIQWINLTASNWVSDVSRPAVILIIGVNGGGKTTTLGKSVWDD